MLTVLLVDAELELAPAEIAGHPAIRRTAAETGRKPSEVLLDQNLHGPAIRKLPEGDRRGRPDITHFTLLQLLESPLNKAGLLRVAVHTRHGLLLRVRPDTRLPRSEARFQGLVTRLLRDGASQDQDPLLWSEGRRTAQQVLQELAHGPVVRLDETGDPMRPDALVKLAKEGDLTVVLGAFAHGDFGKAWQEAAPERASIFEQSLNAWAVAGEIVAAFRAAHT